MDGQNKLVLAAVDLHRQHAKKDTTKNSLRFPPSKTVYTRFVQLIEELQDPTKGLFAKEPGLAAETGPCKNCKGGGSKNLFQLKTFMSWLRENKDFNDAGETTSFTMRMIQLGYIYPCSFDWNYNSLQCDENDNTLCGFQVPTYWPTSSISPNDYDYAMHLHSRSKGDILPPLTEYEQNFFEKLKRKHYSDWSFLEKMTEREHQLRALSCQHDITMRQWQDFSYWKVNRARLISEFGARGLNRFTEKPCVIEESESTKVKKSDRVIETSCTRIIKLTEDWEIFDPMISEIASPNPWLVKLAGWPEKEDEDIPTVYESRRWGVSFELLMRDEQGRCLFEQHLQKEFSVENLNFCMDCLELKLAPEESVPELVTHIFEEYIAKNANQPINIDTKTMAIVKAELKRDPCRYTFESAFDHIYNLMKKDSYRRFLRSAIYKDALTIATDPEVPVQKERTFARSVGNLAILFNLTRGKGGKF